MTTPEAPTTDEREPRAIVKAMFARNESDDAIIDEAFDAAALAIRAESSAEIAAALEVARIAVGVCNDWIGDPDHGFILDRLALPVAAYNLARYAVLAPADAAGREEHTHGPLTWTGGAKSDGGGWKCDGCGAFPVEIGA